MTSTSKTSLKVLVTMTDAQEFFGLIYTDPSERLQDVMNDPRMFLPVEQHMSKRGRYTEDVYVTVMINKICIATVEER